jgi:hypothetical protein
MTCKVIAVDNTVGVMQIWSSASAPSIYDYDGFASLEDTVKVLGESGAFYKVTFNGITGYAKKSMLGNCRK